MLGVLQGFAALTNEDRPFALRLIIKKLERCQGIRVERYMFGQPVLGWWEEQVGTGEIDSVPMDEGVLFFAPHAGMQRDIEFGDMFRTITFEDLAEFLFFRSRQPAHAAIVNLLPLDQLGGISTGNLLALDGKAVHQRQFANEVVVGRNLPSGLKTNSKWFVLETTVNNNCGESITDTFSELLP